MKTQNWKQLTPYWWGRKIDFDSFDFSPYVKKKIALKNHYINFSALTASVTSINKTSKNATGEDVLSALYNVLGTLDTKASALMRLNGVMLAAAVFFLDTKSIGDFIKLLVAASSVASTISIALCLVVVAVDWPFLALTELAKKDNCEELNISKEFFHLQEVVDFRQTYYRSAWFVSGASAFACFLAFYWYFCNLLVDLLRG